MKVTQACLDADDVDCLGGVAKCDLRAWGAHDRLLISYAEYEKCLRSKTSDHISWPG